MKAADEYPSKAPHVPAIVANTMSVMPFGANDEDVSTDRKFQACRQNLNLVGLVASIDPDRDGVPESVECARGAGIRAGMNTGDYLKTAIAIACNVKILMPEDSEDVATVDCARLRPDGDFLSNAETDALTSSVRVVVCARPEDKLEIVKSSQRQGCVTAMTGVGVNDAPALIQANIGVARGIQGTEVAKGASDRILTDDNSARSCPLSRRAASSTPAFRNLWPSSCPFILPRSCRSSSASSWASRSCARRSRSCSDPSTGQATLALGP